MTEGEKQSDADTRIEKWKMDYAAAVEGRKEYAKQIGELDRLAQSAFKDIGAGTVRYLFLLNGGAMIALLAFVSSIITKGGQSVFTTAEMVPAFAFFVGGLAFAVATSFLTYLNFRYLSESYAHPGALANWITSAAGKNEYPTGETRDRHFWWTTILGIGTGWGSALCFVTGCATVGFVFLRH